MADGDDIEGRRARRGTGAGPAGGTAPSAPGAPGKRSLTERLRGSGGALPYRDRMEAAFGTDLGGVTAHVGAADALAADGALGAAEGDTVAFADASPDLYLVAHEVAHVVQQRQTGTAQLAARKPTSEDTDPAEREADAVAAGVAADGALGAAAGDAAADASAPLHLIAHEPASDEADPIEGEAAADAAPVTGAPVPRVTVREAPSARVSFQRGTAAQGTGDAAAVAGENEIRGWLLTKPDTPNLRRARLLFIAGRLHAQTDATKKALLGRFAPRVPRASDLLALAFQSQLTRPERAWMIRVLKGWDDPAKLPPKLVRKATTDAAATSAASTSIEAELASARRTLAVVEARYADHRESARAFRVYRDILAEVEILTRAGRDLDLGKLWKRAREESRWGWNHTKWMFTTSFDRDGGVFNGRTVAGIDVDAVFRRVTEGDNPAPTLRDKAAALFRETTQTAFVASLTVLTGGPGAGAGGNRAGSIGAHRAGTVGRANVRTGARRLNSTKNETSAAAQKGTPQVEANAKAPEKKANTKSNTTRQGIKRNNPRDWKITMKAWDEAGYGGALSPENRARINGRRTPIVDDAWIEWFPGDAPLRGEQIRIHHIQGGKLVVPLPESRHKDAHSPGGYRKNPGGPGRTGFREEDDDGRRFA
jgi:hypothetical protein